MSRRIIVTICRRGHLKNDPLFDAGFVLDVFHCYEYTSNEESLGRVTDVFVFDDGQNAEMNRQFPETAKSLDEIVKGFMYGLMEFYDSLKITKEIDEETELIKYSIFVN